MKAEDLFTWHYRNFTPYPQTSEKCFLHSSFTSPLFIGVAEWTNEGSVSFPPFISIVRDWGFLYVCLLERLRTIHSFRYFGNLIHICIQGGFSNANESILHLSSKLHLLYRCGLWNLRFLSCTSFVNLPSPSNSFTINALRVNEWRLQIFHLPSLSYFQRAEILTKSMGILIISTCSITQMNCMFW